MSRPGRRPVAGLAFFCALTLALSGGSAPAFAQRADDANATSQGVHAYVDGFCLPIAGGYVDDAYAKFLDDWNARPGSSAQGDAARPQDAQAPGQYVHLPDAAAPDVLVDPRRDVCSLIWPSAAVPTTALTELAKDRPPVGARGAPTPWRRISPAPRVGPPRPPRFILLTGGSLDRGVCAERLDDLRRHDGATISMLQLAPCKLAPGEKAVDG